MSSPKKEIIGCLCIAGLVAYGFWHANNPESLGRQLSFNGFGQADTPTPETMVRQTYWSADGCVVLALARDKHSAKRHLLLHDVAENTCRMSIDVGDDVIMSAALAPDGFHVLVGTADGRLLWGGSPTEQQVLLERLPTTECFTATAVALDGRLRAAGTNTGLIYLFESNRYNPIILQSSRIAGVGHMSISQEGTHLVCAQNDGFIGLWDLETGVLLQEFVGHKGPVTAAFLLPGGKQLVSSGLDDTVRIWDVADGREQWHGEFGLFGVTTLAVSQDGRLAAWGGRTGKIYVWDLEHGRKKLEIDTSALAISHLAFSPDGLSLAAAENDALVHRYDPTTGAEQEGIRLDSNLTVGTGV